MRLILMLTATLVTVILFAASARPERNVTDGVIHFLEERLERDPDDFLAAGKLGDTYLQKARESGVADCYAKAERMFRAALKWTPESYPLRVSLASALVSQHKFREAAAMAGKLTMANPDEPAAYGVLGDALLEIGDMPGAEAAYAKLLDSSRGLSSYARIARFAWLRSNTSGALSNLSVALSFSNSPSESLAWARVQKGELFFRTGRVGDAEREYAGALKIFPDYYLALDHMAELRAAQGQFDEAARTFEQLSERTKRPEYLQAVGDVYLAARKPAEARVFHERALAAYLRETDAAHGQYFHHLAGFYADVHGDGVAAEKWARRDLEVRQNVYAWDALAWALYWKKDYTGAVDAMKKALGPGTKDAQLLAHAGSIFVRAGKISEGRELMKRAPEINPHFQNFHVHR
jgi:tetratricopeptide (TPR) repeat protein